MTVSIDIDSLEKFDKIGDEVILADLILRTVEFFHEIQKSRQLEAFWI